ncbi:YcaO-like family protein [Streptomyces sp. NPDC057245]|uniref:YcaO-like family protein n=1 Tax=Streptomyces sp. NPDC057245 TaxID=3346065 RepID=UPI00363F70FA
MNSKAVTSGRTAATGEAATSARTAATGEALTDGGALTGGEAALSYLARASPGTTGTTGTADATGDFRDGTHRMREPGDTLAEYLPTASRIGVTRIADLTRLDTLGIPVFSAVRPLSRSLVVSMGKGITEAAAKASALMESVETWHAEQVEPRGPAAAYRDLLAGGEPVINAPGLPCGPGTPFREDVVCSWVPGVDLLTGTPVRVPWEAVSLDLSQRDPARTGLLRGSNGLASGNCLTEAVLHAVCEVIERDAESLWRLDSEFRRVRLSTVRDANCLRLLGRFRDAGLDVAVWDITSDTGVPAYGCTLVPRDAERFWRTVGVHDGYGCHPSPGIALVRALTEAAQTRMAYVSGSRDDLLPEEFAASSDPALVSEAAAELAGIGETEDFRAEPAPRSLLDEAGAAVGALSRAGAEQVVLVDLTRPGLGIPVVKILVPGFEGPAGAAAPGARASRGGQG